MQLNIWGPTLSMTHIMQQGYILRKPLMDSSWVMSQCHSTFGLNHLLSWSNCGKDFRLPWNNGKWSQSPSNIKFLVHGLLMLYITSNHHQMEAMAFGHYQMVEITFGLQLPFNDQNLFQSPSTYKNDFGFQ